MRWFKQKLAEWRDARANRHFEREMRAFKARKAQTFQNQQLVQGDGLFWLATLDREEREDEH